MLSRVTILQTTECGKRLDGDDNFVSVVTGCSRGATHSSTVQKEIYHIILLEKITNTGPGLTLQFALKINERTAQLAVTDSQIWH